MSGAYCRRHLYTPPCHWEHKLEQSYGIAAGKDPESAGKEAVELLSSTMVTGTKVGHCDLFTRSSINTEHIESIETQIYLQVFSVITAQYQYNGINPRLIS